MQGIAVGITGNLVGAGTASIYITDGTGAQIGMAQPLILGSSSSRIVVGGPFSLFGSTIQFSDLNSAQFGVGITCAGSGTFNISLVDVTVYQVSGDVVGASTFN